MTIIVDLKIFIFLVIFFITGQSKLYGMFMLFAILHELGHLVAGIILKMKIKNIKIMPFRS